MSNPSSTSSGYASPASASASSQPIATKSNSNKPTPKPTNVFTNDGSFLERFQRTKKEEEEKKKQEEDLARKRDFDNRFKNRGKRPPPTDPAPTPTPTPIASSDPTGTPEDPPAKKAKSEQSLTEYGKQVQGYAGCSLKDNGIGVRPLVK